MDLIARTLKSAMVLAVLLLAFAPERAKAQVIYSDILYCFQCTHQQIELIADNALQAPKAPVYVIDWYSGTVKKYAYFNNVTPEWNPEFDPFIRWVEEIPVEPEIQADVTELRAEVPAMHAPSLPVDSAWAVTINQHDDAAVIGWIESTWKHKEAKIMDVLNDFSFGLNIDYWIEIEFDDGSTAIYTYNEQTGKWERKEGQAKDSNGNRIPESRQDIADGGIEHYHFSGVGDPDFWNFQNFVDIMDVALPPVNASGSFGIVCVEDGGGTITCIIQPI